MEYLAITSSYGEVDGTLEIFKAKDDAEAEEKAEEKEVSCLIRLDKEKVSWLRKQLEAIQ